MSKIREHIDQRPELFQPIVDFYDSHEVYQLEGKEYKKTMENNHSGSFQKWLQKKSFYVSSRNELDEFFFSPYLASRLEEAFLEHSDLYRFISEKIHQ